MKTAARRVGRYELVRVIGRGGMATVYLARQIDLDRDVALKELTLFDPSQPAQARRFLREARLVGSLSHPNIVTVHDYVEHEGTPYIAMEYVARGSLRPYVGRMSLAQVGGVLGGLLGGLAHAEERGIVHRDLKPENIMVTSQGTVKIADFGIAKATSAAAPGANLTTTGTTLGTPRYMAPERAMGQEVGPWSDLYSVGIMVFELLVGQTPFHDTEAPMAILMRQINDPVPPVSSLVADVDPAISDWIQRLLVKDPADRIRAASTAWTELDEILVDLLGARWLSEAPLPARPGGAPGPGGRTTRTIAPGSRDRTTGTAAADSRDRTTGARALGSRDRTTGPTVPAARDRTTGTAAPDSRDRTTVPAAAGADPAGAAEGMLAAQAGAATVAPRTHRLEAGPARKPRRRGRLPGLARLALVAGALITAVAVATAGGGDSGDPRRAAVTAGNGQVELTAPAGWREAASGANVPLSLADPVTVARRDGSVTAGFMTGDTATSESLLPTGFLRSLGLSSDRTPPRTRAVLGSRRIEAWRYPDLRPNGSDRPVTVYAAPTTAGVAAVVCVPPSAGGFARGCESVARTLEIRGAQAYPLGQSTGTGETSTPPPADSGSQDDSGVGDSKSDDPSDDEPDEDEP